MAQEQPQRQPLWRRLAWLVVLWCVGVLSLGAVAWVLRRFMHAAGLST